MCNFLSLVVNKTGRVIGDGQIDSHTKLYEINKIKDDKPVELMNWAKIEITPKDGDIFNHNIKNWEFTVDEQRRPDWIGLKHEKACFDRLKKIFDEVFLIGGEHNEIDSKIRFVKDAKIKVLKSKLKVLDGGTVQEVLDGGTVQKVLDGGTVQEVLDGGTVQKVLDGGTVQKVWGGGTVQKVLDGGTVQKVWGGGTVQKVLDGGTVQKVWGGTNIIFFSEESYNSLEKIEGGNNVIIKRFLKDVEVEIK